MCITSFWVHDPSHGIHRIFLACFDGCPMSMFSCLHYLHTVLGQLVSGDAYTSGVFLEQHFLLGISLPGTLMDQKPSMGRWEKDCVKNELHKSSRNKSSCSRSRCTKILEAENLICTPSSYKCSLLGVLRFPSSFMHALPEWLYCRKESAFHSDECRLWLFYLQPVKYWYLHRYFFSVVIYKKISTSLHP